MNNIEEVKKLWNKNGWKFEEIENGIKFSIEFPFDKLKRIISVYFIEKPRKYYYIEVKLANEDNSEFAYENLYVEMKEHMLIHKTLWKIGWLEKNDARRKKKSSKSTDRK